MKLSNKIAIIAIIVTLIGMIISYKSTVEKDFSKYKIMDSFNKNVETNINIKQDSLDINNSISNNSNTLINIW